MPLTIAGAGPELARSNASPPGSGLGHFLGRPSDEAIRELYRHATVALLPAKRLRHRAGRGTGVRHAVVALGRGGALETVAPGTTGILVEEPRPRPSPTRLPGAQTRLPDCDSSSREQFDAIASCARSRRHRGHRVMVRRYNRCSSFLLTADAALGLSRSSSLHDPLHTGLIPITRAFPRCAVPEPAAVHRGAGAIGSICRASIASGAAARASTTSLPSSLAHPRG